MNRMNDLISRQWLMECVNEGWIKFDTEKDENTFIHLVRDIAPSAQQEVIRCKDCKKFEYHRCTRANHYVSEYDHCMSIFGAERRTDAD